MAKMKDLSILIDDADLALAQYDAFEEADDYWGMVGPNLDAITTLREILKILKE